MTNRPDFDVNGWMRLIGEVQQLGLDTARAVAERFSDLADTNLGAQARTTPPVEAARSTWRAMIDGVTDSATQEQLIAAAQGVTDAMLGMMSAAWDFFVESTSGAGAVTWGSGQADLGSAAPGATTSGSVYVHVGRSDVPDEVRLRVGPLTSGAGDELPAGSIDLDPASIDAPQAGRSYEVTIRTTVPKDAVPGTYHGHLFARTVPPSAVPIRVEVT